MQTSQPRFTWKMPLLHVVAVVN